MHAIALDQGSTEDRRCLRPIEVWPKAKEDEKISVGGPGRGCRHLAAGEEVEEYQHQRHPSAGDGEGHRSEDGHRGLQRWQRMAYWVQGEEGTLLAYNSRGGEVGQHGFTGILEDDRSCGPPSHVWIPMYIYLIFFCLPEKHLCSINRIED